jgi:hypothetical protein
MPQKPDDFRRSVRAALPGVTPVWTPSCPEPETMLDWVEQGEAHPQAAALLDHLLGCAYCRREHAEMREIRVLSPLRPAPMPARVAARLRGWTDELVTAGFAAPVALARHALAALDRLAPMPALAVTRGASAPTSLRPASTAIRTPNPILRWSAAGSAQEYSVLVTRHTGRKVPQRVWEGSAGAERHLALPEEARLAPGGVYLWQVTARTGDHESVSAPAAFSVMTDRMQRQVEALERHTDEASLDRIGLYEAFGLFEEALQQVEALALLRPDDSTLSAIRTGLLEKRPE